MISSSQFSALSIFLIPALIGASFTFSHHTSSFPSWNSSSDTVRCLDTLRATDSVAAAVKMSVKAQDPKTKLPSDFEGLLVQEFRSRLRVPKNLQLSVMHGWAQCDTIAKDCTSGVLELGTQAYATAHNNGTVSRIGMIDYALTPAFSDSVGTIIKRIGDEKLIPFFDKPDSIPLDITITIEQHPDSVPPHRQLFKAMLPRFDMTFKLGDYPRRAGGPKYPRIAETRGIGDTVKVSFTILADGTVAPQSVDVLKGHYRDFIRAVFDKLATTSYVPAHIGGCPVASHAVQTFIFAVP